MWTLYYLLRAAATTQLYSLVHSDKKKKYSLVHWSSQLLNSSLFVIGFHLIIQFTPCDGLHLINLSVQLAP